MPEATVNGVKLNYEGHGPEDFEVPVLSNGVLMSTASWALQVPALSRRYAELIARNIPNAELAIIPNAGHAALWEQAEAFNSLILGFLARQGETEWAIV